MLTLVTQAIADQQVHDEFHLDRSNVELGIRHFPFQQFVDAAAKTTDQRPDSRVGGKSHPVVDDDQTVRRLNVDGTSEHEQRVRVALGRVAKEGLGGAHQFVVHEPREAVVSDLEHGRGRMHEHALLRCSVIGVFSRRRAAARLFVL